MIQDTHKFFYKKAVLILYFFVFFTNANNFIEGVDYSVIKSPLISGKGKVIEFFNYGCIHCFHAENTVERLEGILPEDISIIRKPISFNKKKRIIFAKLYLISQELNMGNKHHKTIYTLIHTPTKKEKSTYHRFSSMNDVKRFYFNNGVSEDSYNHALRQIKIKKLLTAIDNEAKAIKVNSTPTFLIDGKYLITGYSSPYDIKDAFVNKISYLLSKSGGK